MKPKPITQVLAENIRSLMEQSADLKTERKLEAKSKVSQKTINNMLSARHDAKISNVEKVAKAFGVSPSVLLLPSNDVSLLAVCQVLSDMDTEGRDLLLAIAKQLLERHGNKPAGTVTNAGPPQR